MKKGSKHKPESIRKIAENSARRGHKFTFSIEHRENLSKANKGQVPWIKGKKQSSKHVTARLESRIRNGTTSKISSPRGENHYLWIFDRSKLAVKQQRNDSAYREWRKNVRNRDGWKCRIADKNCNGKLVAHHILPWSKFPELRYKINNGITLCQHHHPLRRTDEIRLIPTFKKLVGSNKN